MYRILKDKGNNQTITLENLDTNAQINLGKLSITMLGILKDSEGLKFGVEDERISLSDEWNIIIQDTTAKKLTERILNSSIIKIKTKKPEQNKIDAWDVLFGRAKYY